MNSKTLELLVEELARTEQFVKLVKLVESNEESLDRAIREHQPVIQARMEKVIADCKLTIAETRKGMQDE